MNTQTPISDDIVREAADLIDSAQVADLLDSWNQADRGVTACPAGMLNSRTVLIAWYCVALERSPLLVRHVAELLSTRLSPAAARLVGLTEFNSGSTDIMYGRVQRATKRLLTAVDYLPLPTRQRKLTKAEWEATLVARSEDAELLETKRRRLLRLAGTLLGTQYDAVPAEARGGETSVSIDAAFFQASGAGMTAERYDNLGDNDTVASEPDAGFLFPVRPMSGAAWQTYRYGWEVELATLISSDPDAPQSVPNIAVGFNLHRPGVAGAIRAREVFDELAERDVKLGYIVGDRAYMPNARAEAFQQPLRERGASLVMAYGTHQEGVVLESAPGGVLIEGLWYAPALPENLARANAKYREDALRLRKDVTLSSAERAERRRELERERDDKLRERQRWELRPEPRSQGKFEQPLRYGTPEWHNAYRAGRSATESYAATLKHSENALWSAQRRGLRGEAGNAFLLLLATCATNAERIRAWQEQRA